VSRGDEKTPSPGELFLAILKISAMTFGGGYVIVPLMKKRFSDDTNWLGKGEILELTALAQSAPGAVAVNTAALIGYRFYGLPGALLSVAGAVLPPFIILSLLTLVYTLIKDDRYVSAALRGAQAGIAAVIADVTADMVSPYFRQKNFWSVLVIILAFAASWFYNINAALLIVICGVLGAAARYIAKKSGAKGADSRSDIPPSAPKNTDRREDGDR